MFRNFKKQRDLASRNAEVRARRPRRQHLAIEALEGRQLLSLGSEFLVNSRIANDQTASANASSSNGMSVVVWDDKFSSTDHDIRGQLFDSSGFALGTELLIDLDTRDARSPSVAMDSRGDFVVAWHKTVGSQRDILAQCFSNTGATVGNIIQVASTERDEFDPNVAMDASGNFVISYTRAFTANDDDVLARRFNSSGNLLGTVFVATSVSADELLSSVAMNASGQFVIAYEKQFHGFDEDIRLNRYDAAGTLLTNQAIAIDSVRELDPSVALDDSGNAVVTYAKFVGNDFDIKARRVSSLGEVSGEINVRSTFAQELDPAVALSRTGGTFVVAYSSSTTSQRTVVATEVSSVNTIMANHDLSGQNFDPDVSIDAHGGYLLTYDAFNNTDFDIHLRFGNLPAAPAAQNLTLTSPITAGQSATLSGQLVDADGDTNLTLTVNWGDDTKAQQIKPGTKPFKLKHRYAQPGTYTVHATWTDSTGLSNSRDLLLVVASHHLLAGPHTARFHRS